jgi:hypothetical protein
VAVVERLLMEKPGVLAEPFRQVLTFPDVDEGHAVALLDSNAVQAGLSRDGE